MFRRTLIFAGITVFILNASGFIGMRNMKARMPGCPTNYVRVPPLAGYSTVTFCVAKYEARQSGAKAISVPTGLPWTSINRANAMTACQENGLNYDLITNSQWQAIARNIADVATNWSSGSANSGTVSKGHSDNAPANALAAEADDNLSCSGTGQTCDLLTWNSQRRIHYLSNGDIIWDFSGNISEWTSNDSTTTFADGYVSTYTSGPRQVSFGNDSFCGGGNCGYGYGYINAAAGPIIRGGSFFVGGSVGAGVFGVDTTAASTLEHAKVGFRCVTTHN